MAEKPALSIEYCQVCNFRGRAAWLAQEVLAALEADLVGVTLIPGRGGIFEVRLDGELVFSHEREGRFPEPREIKDAVQGRLGREPTTRHNYGYPQQNLTNVAVTTYAGSAADGGASSWPNQQTYRSKTSTRSSSSSQTPTPG